jgi:hypothetical protein
MVSNARPQAPSGYRCLVIGPIGNVFAPVGSPENEIYTRAIQVLGTLIEPACKRFGITAVRADGIRKRGDIPSQVYVAIRDWDLVIADLTDANPNVMYELALRHMVGRCVIAIAEYGHLPFDVSHIRTEQFVRTEAGLLDGRARLENAIDNLLTEDCDELHVTAIFRGRTVAATGINEPPLRLVIPDAPRGETPDSESPNSDVPLSSLPDEDMGFLDLLAEMEDALPVLVTSLAAASSATEAIGNTFERGTAAVTEADSHGGTMRHRLLVAARVARSLDEPTSALEASSAEFGSNIARAAPGIEYLLDQVAIQPLTPETLEFLQTMARLRQSSEESLHSTQGLRTSTAGLANISKALRAPVTRITIALDGIIAGTQRTIDWGQRAEGVAANLPADDVSRVLVEQAGSSASGGNDQPRPKRRQTRPRRRK